MSIWHAVAGAAQWIKCRKAPQTIALAQFKTCLGCPSAVVGEPLGLPIFVMTCGEAAVETPTTCGCVLGYVPARVRRKIRRLPRDQWRAEARRAMVPCGKTGCVSECPQGRWPKHSLPE